jgi:hypothetical protein
MFRSEIAQFAVGVDDRAFVGGDGVGSVFKRGANVRDRGLAIFDVKGRSFEDDIGMSGGEPGMNVIVWRGRPRPRASNHLRLSEEQRMRSVASGNGRPAARLFAGESARATNAFGIRNPSQPARGDAGDVEGNVVAVLEFLLLFFEQTDERAVDVAEAEEAKIEVADSTFLAGLKP